MQTMKTEQKKPLCFGRVGEVTEKKDMILMPLTPLDERGTHFMATIIYDLVNLGYNKKDMEFYFKDFLKKNLIETIVNYIKTHNRMIWKDVSNPYDKEILIVEVV